jgi:hypothetical protein
LNNASLLSYIEASSKLKNFSGRCGEKLAIGDNTSSGEKKNESGEAGLRVHVSLDTSIFDVLRFYLSSLIYVKISRSSTDNITVNHL